MNGGNLFKWIFTSAVAMIPCLASFLKELPQNGKIPFEEMCLGGEVIMLCIVMISEPIYFVLFERNNLPSSISKLLGIMCFAIMIYGLADYFVTIIENSHYCIECQKQNPNPKIVTEYNFFKTSAVKKAEYLFICCAIVGIVTTAYTSYERKNDLQKANF